MHGSISPLGAAEWQVAVETARPQSSRRSVEDSAALFATLLSDYLMPLLRLVESAGVSGAAVCSEGVTAVESGGEKDTTTPVRAVEQLLKASVSHTDESPAESFSVTVQEEQLLKQFRGTGTLSPDTEWLKPGRELGLRDVLGDTFRKLEDAPLQSPLGATGEALHSVSTQVAPDGLARALLAAQQPVARAPEEVHGEVRTAFLQALENALANVRTEPPTVAHLRMEIAHWGQLVVIVALHDDRVHVHAEASSPELGRQFAAALDGLQRLLGERQLRLVEVTVRTPGTELSGGFAHFHGRQGEEAYRERAQFVRSFRWHRLQYVA